MKENQTRRSFIINCTKIGCLCPLLFIQGKELIAQDSTTAKNKLLKVKIDFDKLAYCGMNCEEHCSLYKATVNNDVELKKKIFVDWKMKEKRGKEFSAEDVFCYGCKPNDKPFKPGIKECEVRNCAIGKKVESCIGCSKLLSCDKNFWKEYPDFYKTVLEYQKLYSERGGKLI